jgi:HSP20 family protein
MDSRYLSIWMYRHFFAHAESAWEPPVDVVESDDGLRVQIALPGVSGDGIKLGLEAAGVTISALRPSPCRGDAVRVHRIEIPYGRFERRVALPLAGLELAGKSLENGVLTLSFRRKDGQ